MAAPPEAAPPEAAPAGMPDRMGAPGGGPYCTVLGAKALGMVVTAAAAAVAVEAAAAAVVLAEDLVAAAAGAEVAAGTLKAGCVAPLAGT